MSYNDYFKKTFSFKISYISVCSKTFNKGSAHIVFIHTTSVLKLVHSFMARNRDSKNCLMAELCFHCFVNFDCDPIYIFGFHYKQFASD